MKFLLWYAGLATVLFAAFTAWVFAKTKREKPGDATLDFAFVGFIVYLWLLAMGGAAAVLWRKWIEREPVSRWFWIPAAAMLLGSVFNALRFALEAAVASRAANSAKP